MTRAGAAPDDAAVPPEKRVGAALRAAREAAGLGLREMARFLNYNSHSTLSEYENGVKMPPELVVENYERVLRLPTGSLIAILESANVERHGDAWTKRRVHRPRRSDPPPAAPNGAIAGIPSTPAAAASPWPRERPVADGVDPDEAGCSPDAITVHARRLKLLKARSIIGQIELRYSPGAHAAWGRFRGYPLLDHLADRQASVDVIIEIVRDSDGLCLPYQQEYSFDYQWGDLVITGGGGLYLARATVLFAEETVAHGATDMRTLS